MGINGGGMEFLWVKIVGLLLMILELGFLADESWGFGGKLCNGLWILKW